MTFKIYTLGCKVNTYESEFMASLLIKNGYREIEENADVYIINTCTVTNTSDNKSKKTINHVRNNNPNAIIVVCGCYTQYVKGNINNKDVDIILGNKDKSKIVEILNNYINNHKKINSIYNLNKEQFEDMKLEKFENRTRAFVKIQDGCNNFCSYCIIPYVRGNIRSKSKEKVIEEITDLVNNNHKEIVLTGIHTGHYGADLNYSFTSLLKEISKIKGLERIRISSIEITELTEEFLNELKINKLIVDHLHIPLQSGCDKILKLMNRKYDTNYFRDKINSIRSIRPDISITTDIIVGFPNESEEDFISTMNFAKKIKFTKIHVFPYSIRRGTKASLMDGQIDNSIKKCRVKELIELSNDLENKYYKSFLNKELDVLFEICRDNKYIGHTSNYLQVEVESEKNICNKILKVKINDVNNKKCCGKIEKTY